MAGMPSSALRSQRRLALIVVAIIVAAVVVARCADDASAQVSELTIREPTFVHHCASEILRSTDATAASPHVAILEPCAVLFRDSFED